MINKRFLLSIVIPAYNCEKYIASCIQKILAETSDNIEIVVVDDGSSDATASILDGYKEQVKVFHKKNGGVSSARNFGLKKANGKYVTFLDADDELPSGLLAYYIFLIENGLNYSVVQGCFDDISGNREYPVSSSLMRHICLGYPRSLYGCDEIKLEVKKGVHGCYGKLFAMDYLQNNKITFNESFGLGEDLLFYYDALCHTKNIYIIEKKTYKINLIQGSATRSFNPKMPSYAIAFSEALMARIADEKDEYYAEAMYQINMHASKAISCYFVHENNNSKNKIKELKTYLSIPQIHNAYEFLLTHEDNKARKIKYYLLSRKYVRGYMFLNKLTGKI